MMGLDCEVWNLLALQSVVFAVLQDLIKEA